MQLYSERLRQQSVKHPKRSETQGFPKYLFQSELRKLRVEISQGAACYGRFVGSLPETKPIGDTDADQSCPSKRMEQVAQTPAIIRSHNQISAGSQNPHHFPHRP